MSPQISKGMRIPVDSLAPKTSAKPVTIITANPLMPDLPMPNNKAHPRAIEKVILQ